MGDPTQAEILTHQYELERELRDRTVRELHSHEKQLGELYGARNDLVVRLDRLEQAESRRKWYSRVTMAAVIGFILKALWGPFTKLLASGGT